VAKKNDKTVTICPEAKGTKTKRGGKDSEGRTGGVDDGRKPRSKWACQGAGIALPQPRPLKKMTKEGGKKKLKQKKRR